MMQERGAKVISTTKAGSSEFVDQVKKSVKGTWKKARTTRKQIGQSVEEVGEMMPKVKDFVRARDTVIEELNARKDNMDWSKL